MLLIPAEILTEAREFFEEAGSRGVEGTALIAGVAVGREQRATRLVVPHQVARGGSGCS